MRRLKENDPYKPKPMYPWEALNNAVNPELFYDEPEARCSYPATLHPFGAAAMCRWCQPCSWGARQLL